MSDTENNLDAELAQLQQMQAELQAKMAEIQQKSKELQQKKEEAKPLTVQVIAWNPSTKYISTKTESVRTDWLTLLRATEGRVYQSMSQTNAIPIGAWENFVKQLDNLPNVTLQFHTPSLEKEIRDFLYAPNYLVDKHERFLTVTPKVGVYTGGLRDIPGADYKYDKLRYEVPLPEAWRLHQVLEAREGVVYTEAASEFIIDQVSRRATLDKIATAKDWDITVPGLNASLRNFQKVGIAFFDNNGCRGILADEMGTGKTLQTIAIAMLRNLKTLVILPAALKTNWYREIQKFTGQKPLVLFGGTPTKYDVVNMLKTDSQFTLINYDIYSRSVEDDQSYTDADNIYHKKVQTRWPWIEAINLVEYDLIVFDEAHYIKNVDSNRSQASRLLKANHVITLTGTPVLNRPGELWPLLHLASPETFPAFETFKRQYTWDGKSARNVDELKTLLKPLMIRRKKADVIDDIPALNRITEYQELSPKARKLYDKVLAGVFEVVSTWNPNNAGSQQDVTNILVKIQRLKQVTAIDKLESSVDLATRIYDSTQEGERPKKVLLFSQFKPTAYGLKVRLGQEAIGFVSRTSGGEFVTADQREQQRLIDQFQNDDSIHYLVVTEKTAKEGHNITAAMAVIFNDPFWTPAAHQQAEGRAYMRMGDPHGIDSYYNVCADTIDDWIMELLAAKLAMIEQVVEGVEASRNADESIAMDLIRKLKEGMWLK